MSDFSHYEVFPHPPVVEAIISIEVGYLDDLELSSQNFYAAVREICPVRHVMSPGAASAIFPSANHELPRRARAAAAEPNGFEFSSESGADVIRITRRGLSCHRLVPYTSWEAFRGFVQSIWHQFERFFGPDRIEQVRLRYVNRIHIPAEFTAWDEYLLLLPNLPDPVNTGLAGFVMRLVLQDKAVPAVAYVTLSGDSAIAGEQTSVIFDLDLRHESEIAGGSRAIWEQIEKMREYRDRLFFASITDRTKELFR